MTATAKRVNAYRDYRFQVRIRIPGTNGRLRDALTGEVTGLKLRLSATPTGTALNAAVDNLPATENSADAASQYVTVDTSLLVAWVLTLQGRGASFYAIWSKSGDADMEYTRFVIDDRDEVEAG